MSVIGHRHFVVVVVLAILFVLVAIRERRLSRVDASEAVPIHITTLGDDSDSLTRHASMAEVLELATAALESMTVNVSDYTARFVKQERRESGVLGEVTEMQMKVMPRHRSGKIDAPMRVYLDFVAPESQRGREVIWAEDMYDAQLVAHEGGLLGMFTVRLDPTGFIAMRGERFPINHIGLTRLVELLIERGAIDLDNPDISVTITSGFEIDGVEAELIRVRRAKPSGKVNDFSLAEIAIDRERMLVLQYRSFGWPRALTGSGSPASLGEKGNSAEAPPLIESYTYHDIVTNVGLTDADFDPKNPEYRYP